MSIGETETAGGGRSRWTAAARAYADELLDSATAMHAAAAGLDAAARDGRIDDRDAVLDAIRVTVAQRVDPGDSAPGHRAAAGRGSATAICPLVPRLLAARAAGRLSAADSARLARHIESCPDCAALERRALAAERAFEAHAADVAPAAQAPPPVEPLPAAPAPPQPRDKRAPSPPPAPRPAAAPSATAAGTNGAARVAAKRPVAAPPAPRAARPARPQPPTKRRLAGLWPTRPAAAIASFFVLGAAVAGAAVGVLSLASSSDKPARAPVRPSASSRVPTVTPAPRPAATSRHERARPARRAPAGHKHRAAAPAPAPRHVAPAPRAPAPAPVSARPAPAPAPAPAPRHTSRAPAHAPSSIGPKPSQPSSEPGRLPPS